MNQRQAPAYKNKISILSLWESSFLTWQENKYLTLNATEQCLTENCFQKDSVLRKDLEDKTDSLSSSLCWDGLGGLEGAITSDLYKLYLQQPRAAI